MAKDIITRFKLETTGFDSKIKEAAKNLSAYSKTATQAKEGFNQFTKANVDAARALGTMATSTTNVKDRVKELVGAYNDAAKAYEALTKEQQQSDWAKALAGSLTQLQQRIREAKTEMQGLSTDTKGGIFSGLSGKMEGALAVFGGNMMTKAAGAIASLGTEMFNSVQQGIELAKQGEGIRVAFERLGNGQILQGLREATHGTVTDIELMKAAVKFNDFKLPVEELGTMLAFAQQKAKDTGQSVDYMVDSIVTGLGRKSLMILDNLGLSATEVKDKMKETGDMTKAVGQIIREQMAKAGDYVETAADRAAQANVNLQNKMEELGRKFAPVEEASSQLWTSMKIGILDIIGGPLTDLLNKLTQAGRMANQYGLMGGNAKVGRMTSNLASASEGNRQSIYQQQQAQFWKYINPREQQLKDIRAWQSGDRNEALQKRIGDITEKYGSLDATKIQAEVDAAKKMLSDYQAAAKQILQPIEQKIVPTVGDGGNSGGGGGRSGGGSRNKGFDISSIAFDANKAMLAAVKGDGEDGPSAVWKAITEGAREATSEVDNLTAAFEKLNDVQGVTIKDVNKGSKNMGDSWRTASTAIGAVGNAMSGLKNPAIDVMTVIAQSIATIALAYAQNLAGDKTTTGNIWAFIAAAAASTISMATTIAAIHSSTGYAEGGMIKGNSYSGDNIGGLVDGSQFVGLNAGEIVLNSAQQNNLAQNLQGGGGTVNVVGRVVGEDIFLSADRYARRSGRGSILTGKNL